MVSKLDENNSHSKHASNNGDINESTLGKNSKTELFLSSCSITIAESKMLWFYIYLHFWEHVLFIFLR